LGLEPNELPIQTKKMRKSSWFLGLLILSSTYVRAQEVARVNDTVLTLEELNRKFRVATQMMGSTPLNRQQFAEEWVKRELGRQKALELKLDKDPDVLDRLDNVLYTSWIERTLTPEFDKIKATESDLKSFYLKNPEIRTSHIFVAVKPNATKDEESQAFARIRRIRDEELKKKVSFSEVAQKFSEGPAAPMGGDLDYQFREKLDPAYYEAARKLKSVGQVSDIVRTQFGFHLIRLTGVRSWTEVDRGLVRQLYTNEKKQEIFDRTMANLRKSARVSIRKELLQ
jgi:peptidyl-prolyl cis-trans isomerase C/peptidyl-prolyl cis-trans isomerase D